MCYARITSSKGGGCRRFAVYLCGLCTLLFSGAEALAVSCGRSITPNVVDADTQNPCTRTQYMAGNDRLRSNVRPRLLVAGAAASDCLRVNFTRLPNHLHTVPSRISYHNKNQNFPISIGGRKCSLKKQPI